MEGLATKIGLGAWRAPAPMTLPRSPITATKQCMYICTPQFHYPLSLSISPYRTFYPAPLRIRSAYRPCYSNSKQNYYDNNEEAELKKNLTMAGGLVISVAMAVLSLQGIFCKPALAARSSPSTPISTSTPEDDSLKEEQITKMVEEFFQPQQYESGSSKNPNSNPNPNPSPIGDREELTKNFEKLSPELKKEVLKRTLLAPLVAGNVDLAVEMLDGLIEEKPDDMEWNIEWKLLKAYILDDADRDDEAKLVYEQILQQDPFNAHALQGLALVMHKFGEDAAMIKMMEELVEKAQELDSGVAYNMKLLLAHVYIVQDNVEGALKQYQHLIDENPQDFRPYLCQGIIYTVVGKKDEAKERFEKYSKLVPDSFSEQGFLAEIMAEVQTEGERLSQARKMQEKLMEQGTSPYKAKLSEKPIKQPKFG